MHYELGFIGCGNMGGALVAAAAKATSSILVCDYDGEKVKKLEATLGVVGGSIDEVAKNARFVVLGVKPQAMAQTLAPVAEILRARKDVILVTMAAGLSVAGLKAFVGGELPVIRIMPNTPVALGEGMILYAAEGVSEQAHADFLRLFAHAGKFDCIPEADIDAGSALSGCGPAFVYAFAEALIQGAKECGIPEEKAELYTAQTIKGAAEMLLAFGDPAALRRAVCSPNGTTLAGIKALDDRDFTKVASSAIPAAYKRTLELKQ